MQDMEPCSGSSKGCIMVLSGLPASGKTTLANEVVGHLGKVSIFAQCICYDEILSSDIEKGLIQSGDHSNPVAIVVENDKVTSPWKLYRESIVGCVESLLNAIQNQSWPDCNPENVDKTIWKAFLGSLGSADKLRKLLHQASLGYYTLIIDDNMYYRSMRYGYCQLARKCGIGFCQLHVRCSLSMAMQRNGQRVERVSDHVIAEMDGRFEPPDGMHYPWETYSYTHSSEQPLDVSQMISMIMAAIKDPVKHTVEADPVQVDESRRICSESLVHQLDQILRKLVNVHILKAKDVMMNKETLKNYASKLNKVKTQLMVDMKQGAIPLPVNVGENVHEDAQNVGSRLYKFIESLFQSRLDASSAL